MKTTLVVWYAGVEGDRAVVRKEITHVHQTPGDYLAHFSEFVRNRWVKLQVTRPEGRQEVTTNPENERWIRTN